MELIRKKHINLGEITRLKNNFRKESLNTVCESAKCPNIGECFSRGIATFLIAGDICTRGCAFCGIGKGRALPLDNNEPKRVAENIKKRNIRYSVITSVTRDDLPDGGAAHFVETINEIRRVSYDTKIEVLIPDFLGKRKSVDKVISSLPDVFSHNLETIPRLYSNVRQGADYKRSLKVLSWAKEANLIAKSGIMLGLGETEYEVLMVMDDLLNAGCDIFTLGQYLQPTKAHYKVQSEIPEDTFKKLKETALKKGFKHCASGRYVRSSYLADEMLTKA